MFQTARGKAAADGAVMILLALLLTLLFSNVSPSSLHCNSLPAFEPSDSALYFGCRCGPDRLGGRFSLASFAFNLSHSIFDAELVVDFRDCWSLEIILDQAGLNLVTSDHFRPDMSIAEINLENVDQVQHHM